MTLPTSGPLSISQCVAEFTSASSNMNSLEQVILGRAAGQTVSMSEFYGKSAVIGPPTTQQGIKLVGTGYIGKSAQGRSVALSADGNTLAIGAPYDNSFLGAVWIFTRSNGVWTQQGNKLVGSGSVSGSNTYQGCSVSLNSTGDILAVGGYGDNSYVGAVWIFTRSNGVWTQQGNKLVGSGYVGTMAYQGCSVSLNSTGDILAVGGDADNANIGATWIFTNSGGVWTQQGNKLVGSGYVGAPSQGYAVSLSGNGTTLVVGAPADNSNVGATWIFTNSGGVWTQQGNKLVGSGYNALGANVYQGCSVSIDSTGSIIAFGAYEDDGNVGAAWIFTNSGGVWTQQGNKLVGSGYVGTTPYQGISISLSGNGTTLAVGGFGDNAFVGATWLFTNSGGVWTQQGNKLIGSGYVISAQGAGVALDNQADTLAVGGYQDSSEIGAVWIFI